MRIWNISRVLSPDVAATPATYASSALRRRGRCCILARRCAAPVAEPALLAGGLKALQTASIAAALPVSVIMLLMAYGIIKSLHEDPSAVPAPAASKAPDGTSLKGELRA